MLTLDVYAFEDGPSSTLLRTLNSGGKLVVLRDGREAARYAIHRNHPVSIAHNGLALFDNGQSGDSKRIINLRQDFPQEPRPAPRGNLLHPEGQALLGYYMDQFPYEDPRTGEMIPGLVVIDRKSGRGEQLWHGDTSQPQRIYPFGKAAEEALSDYDKQFWKAIRTEIEMPALILSATGRSWALGKPRRLEIGAGSERLASVYWENADFSYERVTFAPQEDRLVLAGKPGLVCLSLDGSVQAHWNGKLACEPFQDNRGRTRTIRHAPPVSPPCFWGEDLLVVLRVFEDNNPYPPQRWYEVHRFDPTTLVHRGKLDGFPRRRLGEDSATLLPLGDGSLAWVPNGDRILILPFGATRRRSTTLVEIIGDPLPPRLAHPPAKWYDSEVGAYGNIPELDKSNPGERKSLARFLLNELVPDYRFDALIKCDLAAFAPYREQLMGWSREEMEQLRTMDFENYWKITRGASDEAVKAAVARIEKDLPEIHLAEFELFLGVETPLARQWAAEFARRAPQAARRCREHHLMIPENGPAIPRYNPAMRQLVAYPENEAPGPATEGLASRLPHDAYLPEGRGWACNAPMAHLLSADLTLVPGNPLADSPLKVHHWFLSSCEEGCDEALSGNYLYQAVETGSRRVRLIGNPAFPGQRPPAEERDDNPGYEEPSEAKIILRAEPFQTRNRGRFVEVFGQLGGWPEWWQQPEIPDCPACGRMMFFIGQVHSSALREDMPDAMLYAFHCETCGIGGQIEQIT